MTQKYIAGFFLLVFAANYCNFVGFYKILDTLPGAPGKKMQSDTRWYFISMNVLYALTFGLSFMPRFGPWCQAEKVYPPCMNWAACLFIVNFGYHVYLNCKKEYYLSEGPIVRAAGANDGDNDFEQADKQSVKTEECEQLDWADEASHD